MRDLTGSFWIFHLYDVAEEIRLDELRKIVGTEPGGRQPSFRQPTPEYVRFRQPPVIEPMAPLVLETGERFEGRVNYYEYGVVSLELVAPFQLDWDQLVLLSSRWIAASDIEKLAAERMRQHLGRVRAALVKPYENPLSEDYCVIHVHPKVQANELIREHGDRIARIVRGELTSLSEEEQEEVLLSRMSYSPLDLLVVGWTAAFVYDTPEGAAPTIRLLEFANSQLLEFRHYDEVLSGLLAAVYKFLETRAGFFSRWRLAREAERLNTIRLDIRELTERIDNSIKFLSDMFAARLYRLAAARIGVSDYRTLVDEKLDTAEDLYRFMMDQFYQVRGFVLELMIVIILIIDLVFLFKGKS